jgi:3-deoxy-manno-octulosonate cytidylyltransferase (CMP-KDO synthetase)
MKILAVIPSRYGSTRFPGKPLVEIQGKSMIRRVYDQVSKSGQIDRVVVATDDVRIFDHVSEFGGEVVMTRADHESGTDRCAEVSEMPDYSGFDAVLNVQGDEPFMDPAQIDLLCECISETDVNIGTLIKSITSSDDLFNHNIPKVVTNLAGLALYFSRSPIPYCREIDKMDWINEKIHFKHIGMYAFKTATLSQICRLKKGNLEMAESLEQLRWIENGFVINTRISFIDSIGIDTPDDLLKTEPFLRS